MSQGRQEGDAAVENLPGAKGSPSRPAVTGLGRVKGESSAQIGSKRAWAIVWILTGMTVMSFVDRQVLALLVEDLKADLHLSDLQFGLLVGPAFIAVYNTILIPLSMLVDRTNRKRLLLFGCLLWSLMTFCSGFAHSFGQLVFLRSGLAIGEALLAPIAISCIGDLFAGEERAFPTAIFVAGSTVGATSATLFGAIAYDAVQHLHVVLPTIGVAHAWRLTLIAVALPGPLLAALYWLVAIEPARGKTSRTDAVQTTLLLDHVRSHGAIYLMVCVGAGFAGLAGAGLNIWGPAYLMRRFGVAQINAGYLLGGVSAIMSGAGLIGFPLLARFVSRWRARDIAMVDCTLASLVIAVPGLLLCGFATNLTLCLIGASLALIALASSVALPTQLIQIHTPSELKGRVTAFVLFFLFLISFGVGPVLIPFVAANFFSGTAALGGALGAAGALACLVSGLFNTTLRSRLKMLAT
jgi:MFS family permease